MRTLTRITNCLLSQELHWTPDTCPLQNQKIRGSIMSTIAALVPILLNTRYGQMFLWKTPSLVDSHLIHVGLKIYWNFDKIIWNFCPAESPVSVNIINSTHVMCYTALHAAPAAHQILTASTSKLHRQHWSAIIFQPSNIYPVEMNPAGLDWPWFCVLPSLYFPDHIVLSWLLAERNIYFTLTRPRLSWLM